MPTPGFKDKRRTEGLWRQEYFGNANDSSLRTAQKNPNNYYSFHMIQLSLGEVFLSQPEPVFKQHSVSINLVKGGILTNVAWPGPNVEANPSGVPSSDATMIHGLFESPLPGQQVLVGFVDISFIRF